MYRLIEFNWISPGGVLFWDEPEVNLNPRWMKERGVSKAMWADNFADLEPNPILDQYDQMLAEDWRLSKYEAEAE